MRFLQYHIAHDDVIKWKHFPRNWPFVQGIHRSPVNSPHKGQWRGALIFSLICVWINDWVDNREAGDLRRYRTHSDVIVMNYPNRSCFVWVESSGTYIRRRCKCYWVLTIISHHLSYFLLHRHHLQFTCEWIYRPDTPTPQPPSHTPTPHTPQKQIAFH